jgi:glycosyltransferase involved in cell wall biosynthesis
VTAVPLVPKDVRASVAMMTYNHECYIAQAIESVLMQETDFPVELVIGEDFSTDGTRAIVQEYADRYPGRIRLLLPERNQGMNANFEATLTACRGRYVALLEGDDYWTDPHKLQKQVDLLEAHPECSMAVAKTDVYQLEDGQFQYKETLEGKPKALLYFDDCSDACYLHTSTYVIPKVTIDFVMNRYQHNIVLGDTALRYILLDIGPFAFLQETVSVYRITGEGVWTRLSNYEKATAHVGLYESLYRHLGTEHREYYVKCLLSYYLEMATADYRKSFPRDVIRMVILGLRYRQRSFLRSLARLSLRYVEGKSATA